MTVLIRYGRIRRGAMVQRQCSFRIVFEINSVFTALLYLFVFNIRRAKVGSDVPVVIADDAPASVHR